MKFRTKKQYSVGDVVDVEYHEYPVRITKTNTETTSSTCIQSYEGVIVRITDEEHIHHAKFSHALIKGIIPTPQCNSCANPKCNKMFKPQLTPRQSTWIYNTLIDCFGYKQP